MPVHEYECFTCGSRFKSRQNMPADVILKCPDCGGIARRLISGGAGSILKGGWKDRTDRRETGCSPERRDTTSCRRGKRRSKPQREDPS